MPVIINEIVIKTNVEQLPPANGEHATDARISVENVVSQAVEKVLEILEEKKQR